MSKDKYSSFTELNKQAELGGGIGKIEKQHQNGKMTARERINVLLDKDTFVELDKLMINHHQLWHGEESNSRRCHGKRIRKDKRKISLCVCL